MKIVNIVVSGKFAEAIHLRSISNIVYRPERFSGGVVVHNDCTFLLFANGSFVCLGAKSIAMAERSIKGLASSLGVGLLRFAVKNMVLSHNLDFGVNMTKLYKTLKKVKKNVLFEDEMFNGVTWRDNGGTIRLFHNGNFFITGLCTENELRSLCRLVCKLCSAHKK